MDKLKPCQFCGGKSINVIHSEVKYLGQNENGNKKHTIEPMPDVINAFQGASQFRLNG